MLCPHGDLWGIGSSEVKQTAYKNKSRRAKIHISFTLARLLLLQFVSVIRSSVTVGQAELLLPSKTSHGWTEKIGVDVDVAASCGKNWSIINITGGQYETGQSLPGYKINNNWSILKRFGATMLLTVLHWLTKFHFSAAIFWWVWRIFSSSGTEAFSRILFKITTLIP